MDNGTPALFRQGVPDGVRFAVLALLSVVLMLVDGKLQTLEAFRGVISRLVVQPAADATLAAYDAASYGTRFFTTVDTLTRENEALRYENARLSARSLEYRLLLAENDMLLAATGVKASIREDTAVGLLSGNPADPYTNALEIRLGARDGLRVGMPVLTSDGVLGQVMRVWERRSEIKRVSDPEFKFPVLLPRTGVRSVTSHTDDETGIELLNVPAASGIVVGDEVQTSGIDGIFPPGVPVGRVTSVAPEAGKGGLRVTIRLAAEARQGEYAVVVLAKGIPDRDASSETGVSWGKKP